MLEGRRVRIARDMRSMATREEGHDIMTIKDVLAELGISRTTLYERMKEGVLVPLPRAPGLRRQSRLTFRREDVERLKRTGLGSAP